MVHLATIKKEWFNMIWLIIDENKMFYDMKYLNDAIKANGYNLIVTKDDLLYTPTKKRINKAIIKNDIKIVIDYLHPKEKIGSKSSIFTTLYINSENYPFKEVHAELNISKDSIMSEFLGLNISNPKVTLDDYVGASFLHKDIEKMLLLEEMGIRNISAFYLFGVAGAGKTYWAECFAGSTGRMFAELDLAHFMTLENPTRAIDLLFQMLISQSDKYVLLIDEIEKMFQFDGSANHLISEQVFGKMLSWLAKLYERKDNNLCFIATSNKVEKLLLHKPEFVRKGRFDRLYFLHYPNVVTSTKEHFLLHFNKETTRIKDSLVQESEMYQNGKEIAKNLSILFDFIKSNGLNTHDVIQKLVTLDRFNVDRIIIIINGIFQEHKITDSQYFIYTPPEIRSLVNDILDFYLDEILSKIINKPSDIHVLLNDKMSLSTIERVLEDEILFTNPPLQITAPDGIRFQIAQGTKISQGDRIAPFIEIS